MSGDGVHQAQDVVRAQYMADLERLADALVASLVPPRLPKIIGAELAATLHPADRMNVGGDFYDAFPIRNHCWALVVGDVQGKGAKAAGLTAATRHAILTAAIQHDDAAAVLEVANKDLLSAGSDDFDAPFAAVCFGMLDISGRRPALQIACAGAPLPTMVRANGEVFSFGQPGTVLGVFDDIDVYNERIELHAGDTVTIFTDGVFDTEERTPLTQDGLEALLDSCAGLPPSVVLERVERAATAHQRDDVAILAITATG